MDSNFLNEIQQVWVGLDQSKYTIEQIFNNQKASSAIENLVNNFHEELIQKLNQKNLIWIARTHKLGITYLCNDEKAFMSVNICQQFATTRFFTGKARIEGLKKANWANKEDNLGGETFRIVDADSLRYAVHFALMTYEIAMNWTKSN